MSHTTVQTACRASLNQLIETLCKDAAAACGSDIHQVQYIVPVTVHMSAIKSECMLIKANKGGLDRYNAVVVFICGKILTARLVLVPVSQYCNRTCPSCCFLSRSGQVGKSREQAELQSCLDFFFRLLSFTPFIFTTQDSFLDVIQYEQYLTVIFVLFVVMYLMFDKIGTLCV